MADLFIVKERLKFSLKLVGALVVGGVLATWYFHGHGGEGGDRSSFYLAAAATGALALGWLGVLVYFLCALRPANPSGHLTDRFDALPWWGIKILALVLFIGILGAVLVRYSTHSEDVFALLRHGHLEQLEERIAAHPALLENPESKGGPTLAQVAFRENQPEALGRLLALGADPSRLDPAGRDPVIASLKNPPMLEVLLAAGFDARKTDAAGVQPIHHATALGAMDAVALLVGAGAKIDARDAVARTPLMRAIEADDLATAAALLELGAGLNEFDQRGDTALHKAVRRRSVPGTRLLLEKGADPAIFNFIHMTPLHLSVQTADTNLLAVLAEKAPAVDLRDEVDGTPLDAALGARQYAMAELLLERGADIDRVKINGTTSLHQAIEARDYQTARFLVNQGARTDIPDAKGETVADLLRRKQLQGLIEMVEQRDHPEAATNVVESAELPGQSVP